ncbi:MAG: DUF3108 domain-containing protein [Candidatus Eisenbacteria bacterium]|nr:DUF3108 domain-containing protein [Candidatus Eisenbacteria bacterium]
MNRLPDTRRGWSNALTRSPRIKRARLPLAALLAALTLAWCAVSPTNGEVPAVDPSGRTTLPPFGVGESLTFEIKYGFISAGTAVIGIPRIVTERGYPCYHIVSVAESNSFFSVFFTVRDVVESFMDIKELVPLRFEKRLREGDFRDHDLVIFDHGRSVAIYPEQDGRVVPMAPGSQDILTSLYYVRMMDLEVGRSVYIDNHADKKNYPLEIKVLRRDRISVGAGRFDCLVVEPVMRTSGLFRHKGKLTVWLTDDDRRMPVLMKSKVIIGSISAELVEVRQAEQPSPGRS